MKLYGAIDLHSNNNVTVLTDEQDKVVYQKRLTNDLPLILEQHSPYAPSIEGIVVESTYNWYWLVDGLMEQGHGVHLANTAAIQQYEGLKYTDDDSDARWLAHLFRLGVLPEGYIYPKEEPAVRDLLRKRSQLVRQKTANLLSIQNLYSRNTGSSISANRIKQLNSEKVDAQFPNVDLALAGFAVIALLRTAEFPRERRCNQEVPGSSPARGTNLRPRLKRRCCRHAFALVNRATRLQLRSAWAVDASPFGRERHVSTLPPLAPKASMLPDATFLHPERHRNHDGGERRFECLRG